MTQHHAERLARSAKALRTSLLSVLQHVDEISRLAEEIAGSPVDSPPPEASESPCRLDRRTFTVRRLDRECFLGFTLPFRLMEKLAQRPDQYLSVDRLMQELWGGPRAPSTIRSVVCELRAKLNASGMEDLAAMIDGSNPGHYGLMASSAPSASNRLPTRTQHQSDSPRKGRW